MCVSVWLAHVCRGQKRRLNLLELGLQVLVSCPTWVLGIKLGSSQIRECAFLLWSPNALFLVYSRSTKLSDILASGGIKAIEHFLQSLPLFLCLPWDHKCLLPSKFSWNYLVFPLPGILNLWTLGCRTMDNNIKRAMSQCSHVGCTGILLTLPFKTHFLTSPCSIWVHIMTHF